MAQTLISHFSLSYMLVRGEFPWTIFKKAALSHEKASFYYQYNQFFPKTHYPNKEWDKVRGENCSYLKEKKLLRAQSYKASVCTNFDEWITLQAEILQYFSFNIPLFTLKGNVYCQHHRNDVNYLQLETFFIVIAFVCTSLTMN